ncbi:hypothetical protein K7N18_28310 [Burkholderia arboris]|uniref:hypothetical protein n=1 Tax=Burkholderia arboris TaxID=488730 RepID=UPI001CA44062|nr:hypothetical protein [Burkholderia arboris]MBY8608734.1 hypothetical protein [Burkholderia arboris]
MHHSVGFFTWTIRFIEPGSGWVASANALIEAATWKEDRHTMPNTRLLPHRAPAASRSPAGDAGYLP